MLLDMEEVPVLVTFGDFVTSQNSFRLFRPFSGRFSTRFYHLNAQVDQHGLGLEEKPEAIFVTIFQT